MRISRKTLTLCVGSGLLVVGVLVGGAASASIAGLADRSQVAHASTTSIDLPSEDTPALSFPRNDAGETYGSAFGADWDSIPDLVRVITDQGGEGYVERDFLFTPPPRTLRDALGYVPRTETVNATTSDGITIVGTFTLVEGSHSEG